MATTLFACIVFGLLYKINGQFLGLGTIPFGCGSFQYYNATLDMNDPPAIIAEALNEVESYLDYLFTFSQAPSVSFGIVYDKQLIYYKSFGVTNLKTLQRPTPDTIYRIGSISKVFTVLMSYKMRENNKLSFNDPIYKYNNKFAINNPWGITNAEKLGQTLTIQQLASQVSGLPREVPCLFEAVDCINITTAEVFSRLSAEYLIHPTDVQASYSNLAYAILGNVLSEYNGDESYNQTLFDLIIDPLGLKNTGLYLNNNQQKNAATGYSPPNHTQADYVDIGWVGPAGQLFSSINDLAELPKQFFAAYPSLYQDDINNDYPFVLEPQTLREMLRPVFVNPDQQSGFGAPWEMQMLDKHFLRSKGGNINGFSSSMDMVPEMKLAAIAFSNYELDASMFTLPSLEILIPAFKSWMNSMKSAEFTPRYPKNVRDYEGTYYIGYEPLFTVNMENLNGVDRLIYSSALNGYYGLLTWIEGTTSFIYNDLWDDTESCWAKTLGAEPGMTIEFVRDTNGNVVAATIYDLDWGVNFPKNLTLKQDDKHLRFMKYRKKEKNDDCKWKRNKLRKNKVHLGSRGK